MTGKAKKAKRTEEEKLNLAYDCLLDIAGNTTDDWAEKAALDVLKLIGGRSTRPARKKLSMQVIVETREEMFDLLEKVASGEVDPKVARKRAREVNRDLHVLKPKNR